MSDKDKVPDLQYHVPTGRPNETRRRTRLEMDEWLRAEVPKVHWLRIHACRTLGLPKQISWDMREIVLRHWMLDELIRRQLITGDLLGVNATTSNDEAELRQFTQRLTAIIQAGQAVQPQHAEGVDMNGYQPPPPPVMGGAPQPGPQAAYPPGPPAPPQGAHMPTGYAPGPQQPPGPPQQQFAPQPQAPVGPPGYAPPPVGVPMGPPQTMQPPQAPVGPPGAPPQAPPAGGGRRARRQDAAPQPTAPAAPVPPMGPGAPQGFAPAGYAAPAAPGGFAPPVPQMASSAAMGVPPPQNFQAPTPQVAAPTVDLSGVNQKLDQILARIAVTEKKLELVSMVDTIVGRAIYQKGGTADAAGFLTEVGIPLPQ
jgi:hypothetical protein